jgi:hypothetical protein
MIAGVAKALAARANTITAPERMPGITCGSTTRCSTANGVAPSEIAAFSTCGSRRWSDAQTERIMKGTRTCVSAMMTPVSLNMNSTGVFRSPSETSPWFKIPVEPSSSAQPNVRATTEMSSGPMTMRRKMPRQGGNILFRT